MNEFLIKPRHYYGGIDSGFLLELGKRSDYICQSSYFSDRKTFDTYVHYIHLLFISLLFCRRLFYSFLCHDLICNFELFLYFFGLVGEVFFTGLFGFFVDVAAFLAGVLALATFFIGAAFSTLTADLVAVFFGLAAGLAFLVLVSVAFLAFAADLAVV